MSHLLEVEDLTVTYSSGNGPIPAVRGVSFTLDEGQQLGLAGESGSGKSTVALALMRLLPKSATLGGRVLFEGNDVLDMSWGQLRAVRWAGASIVFQGAMHSLNAVHKIGRQIAEPMFIHEQVTQTEADARVRELLGQVGLPPERADAYPHELSGGQRQRVMIAMALACNPRLIIADEPTTALDVMVQAQILHLIEDLVSDHGIGLLIISHDLSVLADTCDRLGVMYSGRLVEIGDARAVFESSVHPYTHGLAQAFPTIGDASSRRNPGGLAGDPPDPSDLPDGCSFRPRCPVAVDRCAVVDPPLWPARDSDSEAACVLVEPEVAR